ncbi:NUDIX hydrolase [Ruminiclostridium papyrosolvens DSM 2782]|uniref:Bis(5'-nucleosyl)-tetraphosphatase [asymmetrical] n=1 Tax=Ruminiclostridium papyrosolvens DSM 2782 TaxID=588581 RepID=F1TDI5_9FIRM|nr:NUDIX domain-containing protein [Ruminiclostridium papyrosolvens]EGD47623.1 NUDIX hydrolase [Ruminiclostridium papyrosolvens DSM 2782]WES36432.1 NUDIX domain-containing protein [Ruminiclostridium papyrosolvens DSM 2782]
MFIEKSCGVIVYRIQIENIEFLAVKSKANGHWGFPKGHMENHESEEQTAKREVFEETGLSVDLLRGFRAKTQYMLDDGISKEVIYFIGTSSEKNVSIQADEIQEYRWLKYSKMKELLSFDNSKQILKEAHDFLSLLNYS